MSEPVSPAAVSSDADPSEVDPRTLRRAGALAALVSTAALWAYSGFVEGAPFAPTAFGDRLVRATPGGIATFFIESLGHWAMRTFVVGVVIGAIVFAAFLLVMLARDGRARTTETAALLGVLAGVATIASPAPDKNLIAILGGVAVSAALYKLTADGVIASVDAATREVDEVRRRAIRIGVGGAVAVAAGGGVLGWIGRRLGGPDRNVTIAMPEMGVEVPARGEFPEIPGLTPEITSAEDHYVVDINLFKPSVEAEGWELDVGGLVDDPTTYTFATLQERFEIVEEFAVLTCISNEVGGDLVGNSAWTGVRLVDVLDAAGVQDGAIDIVFRAADGYSDSIPLDVARDPTVLLAFAQNGEALTQEHGFPVRVRCPKIYGMKNVKWLTSIEVVDEDYQGYWMRRGWSDEAIVKTQTRIDVAGTDRSAATGTATWVAGVAWAGDREIAGVEVSTDGGETWNEAMLREPLAPLAWRQWAYRWTPERAGEVEVVARATDGAGDTQTSKEAPPHPSGASGWHRVSVTVS